ncbi:hypothetical protein ACWC09_50310 [Streptomyces sp. NPDC001617]
MVQVESGPRGSSRTGLECHSVGGALLVHRGGRVSPQVRAFAGGLAKDPEHTLVIVDLPGDPPAEDWEAVAKLLKRRGRSFRVITGRPSRETAMTVGRLLADRLERTVLIPDGWLLPAAGGVLFVPEDAGSGWLGFQPRRSSAWARLASHRRAPRMSRRFPVPDWDHAVPEGSFATSDGGTAEPVPGGVWLRSTDHPEGEQDVHRRRLAATLLFQSDRLTVVLGCPGSPSLSVEDIERFWERVAPDARPLVRFARYGPVSVPEDSALGQILAERFGQEVTVYGGLPTVGEPGTDGPQVRVLGEDGTPGPLAFVDELVYRSAGANRSPASPPVLRGHHPPLDGMSEVSPGVYQYAPDAVLELTQSGLWLRPPSASADAPAVHGVPAVPGRTVVHYDTGTPETAQRLRSLAEEVQQQLDPLLPGTCRVLPAPKHVAEENTVTGSHQDEGTAEPESAAPTAGVPSGSRSGATAEERGSMAGAPGPGAGKTAPAAGVPGGAEPGAAGPGPEGGVRESSTPDSAAAGNGSPAEVPEPAPDSSESAGDTPEATTKDPEPPSAKPGTGGGVPGSVVGVSGIGGAPGAAGGGPATAGEEHGADGGVPRPTGGAPAAEGGVAERGDGVPRHPAAASGPAPEPAPVPVAEPSVAASGPVGTEPGVAAGASGGPVASGASEAPPSPPAPIRPGSLRLESAPPTGAAPGDGGGGTADPQTTAASAPQTPSDPASAASPAPPSAAGPAPDPAATAGAAETPAPAPAAPPGPSGPPASAPPTARPPAVRVQPVPAPGACAVPPQHGVAQERAWMRRALKEHYDSAANHVSRVLSQSPGLRGGSRQSADDVVTDLVAVRLYLTGGTERIDSAVRGATVGPHVPLARCVASGLRRLPSYRGATLLRTTLREAEWQWYGSRRLVTEWAFCSALTTAHPEMAGDVDVLIWSMTARRTALLDPTVPDRVLYLPGTSFKVLGVRDEERRVLLLRELTGPEIGADGSVDIRRLPLDDIAMAGLEQAATEWRDAKPAVRLPATALGALLNPPGLIVSGRGAGTAPPRKGTTP